MELGLFPFHSQQPAGATLVEKGHFGEVFVPEEIVEVQLQTVCGSFSARVNFVSFLPGIADNFGFGIISAFLFFQRTVPTYFLVKGTVAVC